MRTQRELSALSPLHKASMSLHQSMQFERKRGSSLLSSTAKQVLSTPRHTSSIESRDLREKISGQVRALPNFVNPEKNNRLELLIERQYEDRRSRHLNLIKKYEIWIGKLYEELINSEKACLRRWEAFIKASDVELDRAIDELSEEQLLKKEIEVLHAAFDNLDIHVRQRKEEAKKLKSGLIGVEDERERKVKDYLEKMELEMTAIAYLIKGEISLYLSRYYNENDQVILHQKQKAEIINGKNLELISEFELVFRERLQRKLESWKQIHHNHTLEKFLATVNGKQFTNPEERVMIFRELTEKQIEIYNIRVKFCENICVCPAKTLTKQLLDTKIEELEGMNEKIQLEFDKIIQRLVDLQTVVFSELEDLFDSTKDKIFFIAAFDPEILQEALSNDCRPPLELRKIEWKDLLQKVIKYLEDTDTRSQEVAVKFLNFVKSIAQVSDEQKKRHEEEEKKYSADFALRGDVLDENLEKLESEFLSRMDDLKRSITTIDLDKNLQRCLGALDSIAEENQKYCNDAYEMVSLHPYKIVNSSLIFVTRVLEKFGILPIERREDVANMIRQRRPDSNKLKTPEETKRKPGGKEVIEAKPPVEIEEVEILARKWLVFTGISSIMKEIMVTEEDREKELIKKQKEEEEKRREEERRALEEAQRREEAKKSKAKPPAIRQEKTKKDESFPQINPEVEKEEDLRPIDPEGNLCLLDTLYFSEQYLVSLASMLQNSFIAFISDTENLEILNSKETDEVLQRNIKAELESKLKQISPRKTRIESMELVTRQLEIKRHHNRWDRFLAEFMPKKESQAKEFAEAVKSLNEMLIKYKKEQDAIRLQLPKSTSIAEFQGLMRRNKETEMALFQAGSELLGRISELATSEIDRLLAICEDFLSNLQLFEKGGDYDSKEVNYYREKSKAVTNDILVDQNKRKDALEALRKKFENEKAEPVKNFDKDYGNALEQLAAREGIGKKYGAPKRSAQEKIRGEMTKCEKAQDGIDQVVTNLQNLIKEYRDILSAKAEPHFATRSPPLSISIRKELISFRLCTQRYGSYISAFKDENIPNLKPLTWKEDSLTITPTIEEAANEVSRLEQISEPLQELAVTRVAGNFSQKVSEIEKNARDECTKLYSGKAVPEAVDRYFRIMKYYAEEFRLNRCKLLREACVKAFSLQDLLAEAGIRSLGLGAECLVEELCEKVDKQFTGAYDAVEKLRKEHKKLLRPNMANPSCREELETLDSHELERFDRANIIIKEAQNEFFKNVKVITESFRVKLGNNVEVLLYLFDVMMIYEDFSYVPGDEAPEVKRSHIKQLASKKKTVKSVDSGDPRGKKKIWPGVVFSNLKLQEDSSFSDLAQLTSYKSGGQKPLIVQRNRAFREFSQLFSAKVEEFTTKFDFLIKDEEGWIQKWRQDIEILKSKNE